MYKLNKEGGMFLLLGLKNNHIKHKKRWYCGGVVKKNISLLKRAKK